MVAAGEDVGHACISARTQLHGGKRSCPECARALMCVLAGIIAASVTICGCCSDIIVFVHVGNCTSANRGGSRQVKSSVCMLCGSTRGECGGVSGQGIDIVCTFGGTAYDLTLCRQHTGDSNALLQSTAMASNLSPVPLSLIDSLRVLMALRGSSQTDPHQLCVRQVERNL
jgi:hypothetical protein